MEFQRFIQNEYDLVVNESSLVFTPYAELKDVVEQSRRVAEEGINENLEDSERESNMEDEAVREDENEDNNVESVSSEPC